MPLSPGGIVPRDMDPRQWDRYVAESGILADRHVKTFIPEWFPADFLAVPTDAISYFDFGSYVALWNANPNAVGGESVNTTMAFEGLPESIRPRGIRTVMTPLFDNDVATVGQVTIQPDGLVTFDRYVVSGTAIVLGLFTAANQKGVGEGWRIEFIK